MKVVEDAEQQSASSQVDSGLLEGFANGGLLTRRVVVLFTPTRECNLSAPGIAFVGRPLYEENLRVARARANDYRNRCTPRRGVVLLTRLPRSQCRLEPRYPRIAAKLRECGHTFGGGNVFAKKSTVSRTVPARIGTTSVSGCFPPNV